MELVCVECVLLVTRQYTFFFVLAHDWLREIFKMYFLINIAMLAIT